MSISAEYKKYSKGGCRLSEEEYGIYLNNVTSTLGNLISNPQNTASDIGKRIFERLDLSSSVTFSQVSKGCNKRSKNGWFVRQAREIVLKYVQRGTSYGDYLANGGWSDFIVVAAKIAGASITIASGVEASLHASRIPIDAPTKIITVTNSETGTTYEETIIDHPEARSTENWTVIAGVVGTMTVAGIVGHGVHILLKDIEPSLFFSTTERDLLGSVTPNIGLTLVSPDFHKWKITELKKNLSSNPPNWQNHKVLRQMICPLSGDFILFPVKDECGHYFDYRSLRGYQLKTTTVHPLECPLEDQKPNRGWAEIEFDKARFDEIQKIIRDAEK